MLAATLFSDVNVSHCPLPFVAPYFVKWYNIGVSHLFLNIHCGGEQWGASSILIGRERGNKAYSS